MKNIAIFGSTGSIGRSSLEGIEKNREHFKVTFLSTNKNIDLLVEQAKKFKPIGVVVTDELAYKDLKQRNVLNCQIFPPNKLKEVAASPDIDLVIAAMVGFAGLESTIEAIKHKKDIALANKETLVVAGHLISRLVEENNVRIIPIDSEHSAIFQCLVGENKESISKLILTASGGPFLNRDLEDFQNITVAEALKHPNWNMGNKITIDSATLMNKGLEVIEAHWLFGLPSDKIDVIIHPQSIIHSMVEFNDGSIKAQLGIPDMKIPIQYALSYPERFDYNFAKMDFKRYNTLTFFEPDREKFKCLDLAFKSLQLGGTYPVVMNAANEVAVEKFLAEEITFNYIPEIIEKALEHDSYNSYPSFEEIVDRDRATREFCRNLV
ncbi:MAG: 1-deoxy-D-xylulose-5-phosphate reductoisomerase [Ignavibacteria bacterium]|nr:1-deoxy-D-xylulose-5-phosphate reductoisomerase [Ignavibacteria bacterium]